MNYFGKVEGDEMLLSDIGELAYKYRKEIPEHFDHVLLDEFVVMPNHMHGVVFIYRDPSIGTNRNVSSANKIDSQR